MDEDHCYMGDQLLESVSDSGITRRSLERVATILVIEFGTCYGGSAVYFANIMRQFGQPFKVLTVTTYTKPPILSPARTRCFVR